MVVGEGIVSEEVSIALLSVVPFVHPAANRNAAMSRIQIRMRLFTIISFGLSVDNDKAGEIILNEKRVFYVLILRHPIHNHGYVIGQEMGVFFYRYSLFNPHC